MGVTLSTILPAYNEARRLPPFLDSVRRYLDEYYSGDYEVIVVDDGSSDGLGEVLAKTAVDWPELVVVTHPTNRGKGAAVRTGMLAASGERLLFADADGATPIDQESLLRQAIHAGAQVAIGSRLVDGPGVSRQRARLRGLAGRLFAAFARRWLGVKVRDTQCGFKMFSREAGRKLFSTGEEDGYLFDLELLVLAERFGYEVAEVPVNWTEVPGGHLHMSKELYNTLLGLWRVRQRLGGSV
jgi:dolichyl-phosphate beta-glucosyltransferase